MTTTEYVYFVHSGDLEGVEVHARSPRKAVLRAVEEHLPCLLGATIRVTVSKYGSDPLDVDYQAPYESEFPELFDGSIEYQKAHVEKT